jgi:hypothetical protein
VKKWAWALGAGVAVIGLAFIAGALVFRREALTGPEAKRSGPPSSSLPPGGGTRVSTADWKVIRVRTAEYDGENGFELTTANGAVFFGPAKETTKFGKTFNEGTKEAVAIWWASDDQPKAGQQIDAYDSHAAITTIRRIR